MCRERTGLKESYSPMAQIFLFLSQMSPWNLVLIQNLVIWLIELIVVHTGQKRTTNRCLWRKLNSMTWHETWTFPRSLPSYWVLVFKRNVYWHLEQHSISMENARENLDIHLRLMKDLYWSTVTILLTWLNYLVWSMMLWNGDFLLTHLTEVSRQSFWIMEISSHQSLLGTQSKILYEFLNENLRKQIRENGQKHHF